MKLELHLIQSFGPSCLNRDATNSPKDCEFGGVRRARVSSQCFKRSIREFFRDNNLVPVGERTKRLRDEERGVRAYLPALQPQELVPFAIDAFVDTYYAKNDSKKPEKAEVLLFLSRVELEEIAKCIEETWDDLKSVADARSKQIEKIAAKVPKKGAASAKPEDGETATEEGAESGTVGDGKYINLPKPKEDKKVTDRLKNAGLSSDIALFGRMLAQKEAVLKNDFRAEASVQVAHALSTHAVTPELDFFSAVDDLNKDDAGAGMLGVTGFNAAVFYRYALLDFEALELNLKGDRAVALQTARAFLRAFVEAIPSGKQNSMAAQSAPSFGLFVVRDGGPPGSLVNAFCQPIGSNVPGGLARGSVDEFADYWERYSRVYGEEGITEKCVFCIEKAPQLGVLAQADKGSVKAAIDCAMQALGEPKEA